MLRHIGLALSALILAGCSSGGGDTDPVPTGPSTVGQAVWDNWRGPHHTGVADSAISSANVATLTPRWSTALDDPVFGTPIVAGKVVVVGGKASTYGLDRTTGAVLWKFTSPQNYLLFSSPTLSGSSAIVSTAYVGAATYALNVQTGAPQWSHDFGTAFSSYGGALVDGESVFIGLANQNEPNCSHGSLLGLDLATGATAWTHDTAPEGLGAGIWSGANLTNAGNIVVTTGNPCGTGTTQGDSILAFTATGTPLWSFQAPEAIADDPEADFDFGSTPVDTGGAVVAVSKDGIAYSVDASSGQLRWEYRVAAGSCCPQSGGSISSPAWDGTRLYLGGGSLSGDGTGRFVALTAGGQQQWSVTSPLPVTAPPTIANDVIAIGLGNTVSALRASDGSLLWKAVQPAQVWAGVAIAGTDAVTASSDGTVTLYELPGNTTSANALRR